MESLFKPLSAVEPSSLWSKGLLLLIFLVVTVIIYRLTNSWINKNFQTNKAQYQAKKRLRLASTLFFLLMAASLLSSELRTLSVFVGFASAGIAFALQEVIVSIAGWVAVLTGKFYAPGDRIQLGGIYGDVLDVGVLRTTLMECGQWVQGDQYNGRIVRVANSFIFKEPVFNYSSEFPFLWDEIAIPVKTNSDQVLARRIIQEMSQAVVGEYVSIAQKNWKALPVKYRIEAATLEPQIYMSFDANWVTYNLRYVVDYRKRRSTKDHLFSIILSRFNENAQAVQVGISSQEVIHTNPSPV